MSGPMNNPGNNPMNDHDLTNALKQRADDFVRLGGHDMDLAGVLSRAGEIRRGRRMRASIVMAAVALAIAVPVGVVAIGDDNPGNPEPGPAVTSTPTPTPNTDRISFDGLKTGKAPATGYRIGDQLYADGQALGHTDSASSFLARINGGFLIGGANDSVGFIADDGSALDKTWPFSGGFAVSPEGNVGAFVEPDGTVIAVQDGGSRQFDLGKAPAVGGEASWIIAAVTGENCSGRSEEPGCTVYLNNNGTDAVIAKIQPNRDPILVYPELQRLADVEDHGWAAGTTSVSDTGSCSAVLDKTDTEIWKTCDYSFGSFSPNGKYLLAGPAYRDGSGDGSLAVIYPALKSSDPASIVVDLKTADGALVYQATWEDSSHVLAVVFKGDEWAVVRIGMDGSRELALPVIQGTGDFISPYTLG